MGGGKSQKGGKHGTIGRTLAHDILLRQSQKNEEAKKNVLKKKEYSVYERNDLDEFTMAATQGLESFIARRGVTREVTSNDLYSQLYEFINFPQFSDDTKFPVIPIPRRSFLFTKEQKLLISKLNRQRSIESRNSSRKYYKKKNKKKVDMYMHGDVSRPYHGYYNKPPTQTFNRQTSKQEKEDLEDEDFEDSELDDTSSNDDEFQNSSNPDLNEDASLDYDEDDDGGENEEDEEDQEEEKDEDEDGDEEEEEEQENRDDFLSQREGDLQQHSNDEQVGDKYYYVNKYLNYLREQTSNVDISKLDPEELDKIETLNFYTWRSLLSEVEAREKSVVTPYEKNIDFWRQLWRVIEKSNLVLIILDSRDPLFFRIKDLETYIKELDPAKQFVLVLNKADFLTRDLRVKWANYFKNKAVDFLFFSSVQNSSRDSFPDREKTEDQGQEEPQEESLDFRVYNVELLLNKISKYKSEYFANNPREPSEDSKDEDRLYVVGFVGYPNVGKSSLINCLMDTTKASVGVQPGKTKHMQTLILKNYNLLLCDCPGLIFPSLVLTKYHLLINNIVSTSHFKGNMVLAVQLICNLIPLQLCKKYDVNLDECLVNMNSSRSSVRTSRTTNTQDGDNPQEAKQEPAPRNILFSLKFLELLCKNRKFFSGGKGGQLDYTRASKLIINDFTQGALLYCKEPPSHHHSTKPQQVLQTEERVEDDLLNHLDLSKMSVTTAPTSHAPEGGSSVKYIGKTLNEYKKDEDNVNQWLKQQLNQDDATKVTKRKMRFLMKGKRKTNTQ